jgi:uncharacterized membrane protein SpoIIM required for sporulation
VNINEFIQERKEDWEKLEHIARKLDSASRSQLTGDELWELGRLYTGAVSDLSTLKSSSTAEHLDRDVLAYLNNLVIRTHGGIYRKPPFRWSSLTRFFARDFPGIIRESGRYVACSATVFVSFALLGFSLGLKEPGFIELLVPESMIARVEEGKVWFDHLHTVAPMASSWLMTHNISVTFLTIAAGITFGIGTVYLLAINGLLLGTVAALCFGHGLSVELWSFVLPHGSLELSAVCIAGAAGLMLGHSLIDPGPYRRSELLASRSRLVGALAAGCVPMLALAGLIEAFFSPARLPEWLKFLFAGVSFSSLVIYLSITGRAGHGEAASTASSLSGGPRSGRDAAGITRLRRWTSDD